MPEWNLRRPLGSHPQQRLLVAKKRFDPTLPVGSRRYNADASKIIRARPNRPKPCSTYPTKLSLRVHGDESHQITKSDSVGFMEPVGSLGKNLHHAFTLQYLPATTTSQERTNGKAQKESFLF